MRLGLTQSLRAEQRLMQSPQMIQAMQILQTPLLELKDQIEGIEQLKKLPFVDASRLGLSGWSYGGYMALTAATRSPGAASGRRISTRCWRAIFPHIRWRCRMWCARRSS